MSARRPILVCEYLLADAVEWQTAGQSMRLEAAAMLSAIVRDLDQLQDVRPVVLLSAPAADMLQSSGRIDANTEIIIAGHGPADWLRNPSHVPSTFDATLIIAPECGQILTSLLKQVQSDHWKATWNLNVPWSMAEIFADKYRTSQWLQKRGIRTPPTKTLDDAAVDELCSSTVFRPRNDGSRDESLPMSSGLAVIKPRDGVGCDRIQLITMRQSRFNRQPPIRCVDDPWVLQRFLPGAPCSVGFIGGGPARPALILPPAQQDIRLDYRDLRYYGGQIPCLPDFAPAVVAVAQQLAGALGSFSGYVGADLVVTRDPKGIRNAHVIEINPRLCTSYVGYRAMAGDSLAAAMLQQSLDHELVWKSGAVRFDSAGTIATVDTNP